MATNDGYAVHITRNNSLNGGANYVVATSGLMQNVTLHFIEYRNAKAAAVKLGRKLGFHVHDHTIGL